MDPGFLCLRQLVLLLLPFLFHLLSTDRAVGSGFCFLRLKAHFCLRKAHGRFWKTYTFHFLHDLPIVPGRLCQAGGGEGIGSPETVVGGHALWWRKGTRAGGSTGWEGSKRQALSAALFVPMAVFWINSSPKHSVRRRGEEELLLWCSFRSGDNPALRVRATSYEGLGSC